MGLFPGLIPYVIILFASVGIHGAKLMADKTNEGFHYDVRDQREEESIKSIVKHQNGVNDTTRNASALNYSPASELFVSMEMEYDKKHSTQPHSGNNDAKLAERKRGITTNDAAERKQSMQREERNNLHIGQKVSEMSEITSLGGWNFDQIRTMGQNTSLLSHEIHKRAIRNTYPSCKDHVTRSFNSSSNMSEIMIAALLPDDDRRPFSIRKIEPAMLMAIDKMNPLLARYNHTLVINFRDSKCDIADSINEAINFYVDREVDILFGPCCDYALAPVARQVKYWNLPLITAGGLAAEFGTEKKTRFSQITRVGPNYNTLVYFFREIMRINKWRHLKLLYNPDGQSDLSSRTCHIAVNDLHYGLFQSYEKFENVSEVLADLPGKIDYHHAGK